jgi:predicted nucleic acid-binding protein
MNYVLDTNIIVHYIKKHPICNFIDQNYAPFDPSNLSIISIVTQAELESLAIQINLGDKRRKLLYNILKEFLIINIDSEELVKKYAEIDAFSQGKLISKPLPNKMTSRNMGKNDLWIASTAAITNSTLMTTDNDFDHLDNEFFKVIKTVLNIN